MNGTEINTLYSRLQNTRASLTSVWDRIFFFCDPASWSIYTDGPTRAADTQEPINGIGVRSAQDMASGLYSNTLRVGEPWFSLVNRDRNKMKQSENLRRAYTSATNDVLAELANSNLVEEVYRPIHEYAMLGTGCIYMFWTDAGMRFKFYSMRDIVCSDDADGHASTVIRACKMDATQVVEFFALDDDKVPGDISSKATTDQRYEQAEYLHAVLPNRDYVKGSKLKTAQPFVAYWVSRQHSQVIRTEYLPYMPYAICRSRKASDFAYGTGAGTAALPDLDLTKRVTEDFFDAHELDIEPPVFLPAGVSKSQVDMRRGGVNNILNPGDHPPVFARPGVDMAALYNMLQRQESIVGEHFFVNLFRMLASAPPGMTATEVIQRNDEKIQLLIPIVSGLMNELYRPIILNTATSMALAGRLSASNLLIDSNEVQIEYSSRLASQLKQVQGVQLLEYMQILGNLANLQNIELVNAVTDLVKVAKRLSEIKGIDPELIRSETEIQERVERVMQERARNAEMQASARTVLPLDLNKAPEPGSPLSQLQAM